MGCIYDEPYEPYICEADWNCKECPNWVEDRTESKVMGIREGHELQDYTKLVSIQLLKVLKTEIDNISIIDKETLTTKKVGDYKKEVRAIIDKHLSDLKEVLEDGNEDS